MLKPLFKHELKATSRRFFPLLLILAGGSLIARILFTLNEQLFLWQYGGFETFSMIFIFLFYMFVWASFIATLIFCLQRYYTHLFQAQGYLSLTLPVEPYQHIVVKTSVSTLWTLINSTLAVVAVVFSIWGSLDASDRRDFWAAFRRGFRYFSEIFGVPVGLIVLQGILVAIILTFATYLMYFACLSVGHRVMPRHPILGSILMFLAYQTIYTTLMSYYFQFADYMQYRAYDSYSGTPASNQLILLGFVILHLLLGGIGFYLNNNYLSRHVNVE